ncbi:MAG: hypothetical protein ACK5CE_24420 [Actinomycetes bacterium]
MDHVQNTGNGAAGGGIVAITAGFGTTVGATADPTRSWSTAPDRTRPHLTAN